MDPDQAAQVFKEFVTIIKALRTPHTGCPWDLEQDHHTLRPYLLEEAYEVLDAIERVDERALREELGDLLLQVVLHAQVADDRGGFSIIEVLRDIADKMVRRHPHVFGSVQVADADEVRRNWEAIKATEKQGPPASPLAGVPEALPALMRAQRLGEKAARVGVDWTSLADVFAKVREEMAELEQALRAHGEQATAPAGDEHQHLEHELGDLLFTLCQLARWLDLSAEEALRACTRRFLARFQRLEQQSEQPLAQRSRTEIEAGWQKARHLTPE